MRAGGRDGGRDGESESLHLAVHETAEAMALLKCRKILAAALVIGCPVLR